MADSKDSGLLASLMGIYEPDSALGKRMFASRYGSQDEQPSNLARSTSVPGIPMPDSAGDVGQADRYFSNKQFVKRHGAWSAPLSTAMNRLHESTAAWIPGVDGTVGPNTQRLDAGDRGVQAALSELATERGPDESGLLDGLKILFGLR